MPKEKEFYRDVVACITESTGKILLGVNDVRSYLKVGYNTAVEYMDGQKKVSVFDLAKKLIKGVR